MRINLLEKATGQKIEAFIQQISPLEFPPIKAGWKFDWLTLFKTEGAFFFKISLKSSPHSIEGLVMFSRYFGEMIYMNNLELAPHNIGKEKKYDWVAGCLLAYGCRLSLEIGKGNYQGYLTFESKTALIPLYKKKYGATRTLGQKMFIDDRAGRKLIAQYLETEI